MVEILEIIGWLPLEKLVIRISAIHRIFAFLVPQYDVHFYSVYKVSNKPWKNMK